MDTIMKNVLRAFKENVNNVELFYVLCLENGTGARKSVLLKVSEKCNTVLIRIPAVCVLIIYHYMINDPKT